MGTSIPFLVYLVYEQKGNGECPPDADLEVVDVRDPFGRKRWQGRDAGHADELKGGGGGGKCILVPGT